MMNKVRLLVFFIVSILCLSYKCEISNSELDRILWSSSRKLTWKDFKGKAELLDDEQYNAMTYVFIDIEYELDSNYIEFYIPCLFNRDYSWSNSKNKELTSKYLLEHEQLHFDIAELIARKIRKEYSEYISYNLSDTYSQLQDVYDKFYKVELAELNQEYDRDTNHGKIRGRQLEWEKRIENELLRYKKYSDPKIRVQRISNVNEENN